MSALRCDIFSIIVLVARPKSFGFGLVSDSWRLGLATKPNPNNLDLTQFSYPSHLDQAWFPDPSILGLYYFLFDNSANNMSSVPAKLKKKKTCQTMRRSSYPDFGHHSCQKIRVAGFFLLKTHFQTILNPRHLENHLSNLLIQSLTFKSVKNRSKTQNQLENQFFLDLISDIFRHFQDIKKTPKSNFSHYMKPYGTKI